MKAISKQYQAQIRKFKLKILNRVQQSANEISSSDLFKSGKYFTKRFLQQFVSSFLLNCSYAKFSPFCTKNGNK